MVSAIGAKISPSAVIATGSRSSASGPMSTPKKIISVPRGTCT